MGFALESPSAAALGGAFQRLHDGA